MWYVEILTSSRIPWTYLSWTEKLCVILSHLECHVPQIVTSDVQWQLCLECPLSETPTPWTLKSNPQLVGTHFSWKWRHLHWSFHIINNCFWTLKFTVWLQWLSGLSPSICVAHWTTAHLLLFVWTFLQRVDPLLLSYSYVIQCDSHEYDQACPVSVLSSMYVFAFIQSFKNLFHRPMRDLICRVHTKWKP